MHNPLTVLSNCQNFRLIIIFNNYDFFSSFFQIISSFTLMLLVFHLSNFSRMGSQFDSIEIRNQNFSAFIDSFTNNTYIMLVLPDGNISTTATMINIRSARKLFDKLDCK